MASDLSRRTFMSLLAAGVGGVAVGRSAARAGDAPPPRETGLSSEGLLVGKPGFQPRTVAPLPHDELPGFLSRAQLTEHHAEYVRATEALKAAEQALASARSGPGAAGSYADLRRRQVAAANDTLLHELYFRNL